MTDDLSTRLLAELQRREDEANGWEHDNPDEGGYYACPAARTEPLGDLPFGEDECTCGLAARRADVLRLCQAHREIVRQCHRAWDRRDEGNEREVLIRQARAIAFIDVLHALATAYNIQEET